MAAPCLPYSTSGSDVSNACRHSTVTPHTIHDSNAVMLLAAVWVTLCQGLWIQLC